MSDFNQQLMYQAIIAGSGDQTAIGWSEVTTFPQSTSITKVTANYYWEFGGDRISKSDGTTTTFRSGLSFNVGQVMPKQSETVMYAVQSGGSDADYIWRVPGSGVVSGVGQGALQATWELNNAETEMWYYQSNGYIHAYTISPFVHVNKNPVLPQNTPDSYYIRRLAISSSETVYGLFWAGSGAGTDDLPIYYTVPGSGAKWRELSFSIPANIARRSDNNRVRVESFMIDKSDNRMYLFCHTAASPFNKELYVYNPAVS